MKKKSYKKSTEKMINEIEDAVWSFDEEEGINIIKSRLESLKNMIEPAEKEMQEIIYKNDIEIIYKLVELPYIWEKSPFIEAEFVCLLVVNDTGISNDAQNYISRKLIDYGCKYAVCTGHNCSTWDDSIDWSYLAKYNFEPNDDDFVMTALMKMTKNFIWMFLGKMMNGVDILL